MSGTRAKSFVGSVVLLALAALAGAGCRSANPAPPVNTTEPPLAARQWATGNIIQTSATETTPACSH